MTPAVQIENLRKVFRLPQLRHSTVTAVDGVSLAVPPGEVYGLIGPNGSGKSTTMKILLGLIRPTAGSARIFGRDSQRVESRAAVGFLPENPYFYKHLTAAETLSFYGRLCGLSRGRIRERSAELLELVDLRDARDRRLGGFSKGMLQRIGLAQALIQEPRLLVLDEPTAGVDPAGSRAIRDLILRLRDQGITVILCSHLLEQVQEVCDRIGMMFRGRLVREGALQELVSLEDQSEIVLQDASPELLEAVTRLVKEWPGPARILRAGHPHTTLERLFLEETGRAADQSPASRA